MGSIIDDDGDGRRHCQIDIELAGDLGAGRHWGRRRRPSATIISKSSVPADQTVKNVPSIGAPGLTAAGLETCLGSVSGGGAFVGTGFSFGTTIPDPGCAARLDARTLWSMGLKKAAVARLCLNGDIYRAMPEVCDQYLPPRARPPVPTVYAQAEASEEQPYTGGDILLVDGTTGKNRLCNDYDVTQQRCRVWAHTVHHSAPKKKATASGETSHTAASPAPARAVAKTEGRKSHHEEAVDECCVYRSGGKHRAS